MTPTELQRAVAEWLADVSGLGDEKVLIGVVTPDIAVKLAKPYMTVTIVSLLEIGDDALALKSQDTAVSALREARISLQVFGTGAMDALAAARLSCSKPLKIASATALGFQPVEIGVISPLMNQMDTGFEERAQADFTARYTETEVDTGTGIIESIVAPGDLDPPPTLDIDVRAP